MAQQVVVFRMGNESFAVNIGDVKEIVRLTAITSLPNTPDYATGVVNLRGRVTAIFDLRKLLGLPYADTTDESRIVVLTEGDTELGIIVDGVSETLTIPDDSIDRGTEFNTNVDREYVTGIARLESSLVLLLDWRQALGAEDAANEAGSPSAAPVSA